MGGRSIAPLWLHKYLSNRQRVAYELSHLPGYTARSSSSAPLVDAARRRLVLLHNALNKGESATLLDFDVPAADRLASAGLVTMVEVERMVLQNTLNSFLLSIGASAMDKKGVMDALSIFVDMRANR